MRVRMFELRLLAVALTVLWASGGGIVLLAYRPGGPADLFVGAAALLPLLVSVAPIVWPPIVRGGRATAAVVWLGLAAALLLIPAIAGVTNQILTRGAEPLLPSLEVMYPWFLALIATSVFAGLGLTRPLLGVALDRRRVGASLAIGAGATTIIAVVFAGVSLADDAALRDRPAISSRFGPTAPGPDPPNCNGSIKVGSTARLEVQLWGSVDDRSIGEADLSGARSGADVRWTAQLVTSDVFGQYGTIRIAGSAWQLAPGRPWRAVPAGSVEDQLVDATVFSVALTPGNRTTAEELGLEFVEGARARHCRVAVDGDLFAASFPQIRWLVGSANLLIWRGQLDYWVFGDGEVGKVTGSINGDAGNIRPHGLQATVYASLTATYRGVPAPITAP